LLSLFPLCPFPLPEPDYPNQHRGVHALRSATLVTELSSAMP
jgi:hypothetical protein